MESATEPDSLAITSKKLLVGRYWKKILGHMADSIVVYDVAGSILYANEMASQDLRYASVSQLLNQTIQDIRERFLLMDEAGCALEVADLPNRRALREKGLAQAAIHFVTPSGSEDFWLEIRSFAVVNRHNEAKFVVSTYHDISAFKQAEDHINDTNRRIAGILDGLLKLD